MNQNEKKKVQRATLRNKHFVEQILSAIYTGDQKLISEAERAVMFCGFDTVTEFFEAVIKQDGLHSGVIRSIKAYYNNEGC